MTTTTIEQVAGWIGGRVECLGGNIFGAVRREGPVEIIVTDDGDSFVVTACATPNDDDHDHTDDPTRSAETYEEVTVAVTRVVADAREAARG